MQQLATLTRNQMLNIWRAYRRTLGQGVGDYARMFPTTEALREKLPTLIPSDQLMQLVEAEMKGSIPAEKTGGGGAATPDQLAEALRAMLGGGQGVDEAKVRAIVNEVLADWEKPTAIQVVHNDHKLGEVRQPHPALPEVVKLVSARTGVDKPHILLVGPAGCGKTTMAQQLHEALGHEGLATVVSCSGGQTESKLLGRLLPADGGAWRHVAAALIVAIQKAGVVLLDELDAGDNNTLLVVNSLLANGFVDVETESGSVRFDMHDGCVVLAAANTYGNGADMMYVGRNQLDAATLDRFLVIPVGYDQSYEKALAANTKEEKFVDWVHSVREKAATNKLRRVVSTRMVKRGLHGLRSGLAVERVRELATMGWTADELRKVA